MTHSEFFSPDGRDEFEQLTAALREEIGDLIQYNERDGYYAISLSSDMTSLREAYSDHMKAYFDIAPGQPIREDYYDMVEYRLNKIDMSLINDFSRGEVVSSVGKAVFFTMDFDTDGPLMCYDVGDEDAIVGIFHSIIVVPVPTGEMGETSMQVTSRQYEPAMVWIRPSIEDASGELHDFGATVICVPFFDPATRFVKRVYQERTL